MDGESQRSDWLNRKQGIDHLDFETKHVIKNTARPSAGMTLYASWCEVCGASIAIRRVENFEIARASFREEPCRGSESL